MSFETFYKRYPRRVKPLNAKKAYAKALSIATHEEIMEGLERFIKEEPWHGQMQFCPHPASWLNAGEWLNEYPEDNPIKYMAIDERREYGQRLLKNVVRIK